MLQKLYQALAIRTRNSSNQIIPLGVIGFFGFPVYYIIWHFWFPQAYESLPLRLFGSFICLLLVFKNQWPSSLKKALPVYWYFVLLYSLPFFFTYLLLKNHFSDVWIMSEMAALFMLILLVDWLSLTLMTTIGAVVAFAIFFVQQDSLVIPRDGGAYLFVFLFVVVVGAALTRQKESAEKQKLEGMAAVTSNVAHEVRTPLLGIKSGTAGLKNYIPLLYEGYLAAKDHGLPVPVIRTSHFNDILPAIDRIQKEVDYANTIIDVLLLNIKREPEKLKHFKVCSMRHCIDETMGRYPFTSTESVELIHWDKHDDFEFYGSDVLLIHVLFNLIKNALYYIAEVNKGYIELWYSEETRYNVLHFKDTSKGISVQDLPLLFERFFTTSKVGTGIGLSFCRKVVESFGGKITCQSVFGEYTEFLIHLPKVDGDKRS
tara:strand:+ start:31521 stop:32810 length:1290 start_codon:yes stop_codon:yes gene_type:complete